MSKLRMIHCGKMILYSDDNENDNNNNNKDNNDKWELGGPPTVGLCQLHRRAELQALQAKTWYFLEVNEWQCWLSYCWASSSLLSWSWSSWLSWSVRTSPTCVLEARKTETHALVMEVDPSIAQKRCRQCSFWYFCFNSMDKSVLLMFVFQVSDEDSTDTNTVADDEDDINADLFDIRGVSLFRSP